MALGVKRISAKKTLAIDDLREVATEWLPQEIRDFASQTALEENREQSRQGNFPTRVVIDKRTTIDLEPRDARALAQAGSKVTFQGLDNNIRFFYTDTASIKQAVQYAWTLLLNLTRALTPPTARRTYYLWCSDPENKSRNRKFETISGALTWLDQNQGPLISVRILGPTIEYRRAVIYNPRGRRQQTRWVTARRGINEGAATDRYRYTKPAKSKINPATSTDKIAIRSGRKHRGKRTYQVQVAKAIQEIVIQNMKRQFRDTSVKYRFVRSKELPLPIKTDWKPSSRNWHIPELSIWARRQHGRTRTR